MTIYDYQVNSIAGEPVILSKFRGKVLLIVNTASRCSYSRQFAELQKLYETHAERGFEILGFPCNQFNEKEPGTGIKWNFTKFLIDRNGHVCNRYETVTEPFEIEPAIKTLLL